FQTSWDVASEPDGPATLQITVEDLTGNLGTSSIGVSLDSTPPTVHLTAPRDSFASAPLQFLGTADDANLVTSTLSLTAGPDTASALYATIATGTTPVRASDLALLARVPADGVYPARLEAVDKFGNRSFDLAGFVVDTTPPSAPTALVATVSGRDV